MQKWKHRNTNDCEIIPQEEIRSFANPLGSISVDNEWKVRLSTKLLIFYLQTWKL